MWMPYAMFWTRVALSWTISVQLFSFSGWRSITRINPRRFCLIAHPCGLIEAEEVSNVPLWAEFFFFLSGFYLCHIFNFAESLVLSYKKQPNNIFSWYSGVHLIAYWITAYLIYWDKISMYGIASLQIYSNSVIIIAYFSHHIDISIQNFI